MLFGLKSAKFNASIFHLCESKKSAFEHEPVINISHFEHELVIMNTFKRKSVHFEQSSCVLFPKCNYSQNATIYTVSSWKAIYLNSHRRKSTNFRLF